MLGEREEMGIMTRYEFTVLKGEGKGEAEAMSVLADRCVVEADSLPEAASKYARLVIWSRPAGPAESAEFAESAGPAGPEAEAEVPVSVSWCEADGCQAATLGLTCESCSRDITHEGHAVVKEGTVVYPLCVACERKKVQAWWASTRA